jgi:hypothetical protein
MRSWYLFGRTEKSYINGRPDVQPPLNLKSPVTQEQETHTDNIRLFKCVV